MRLAPLLAAAALSFHAPTALGSDVEHLIVPQLGIAPIDGAADAPMMVGVDVSCDVGLLRASTRIAVTLDSPRSESSRAVLWMPLPAAASTVEIHREGASSGGGDVVVPSRAIDAGLAPRSALEWSIACGSNQPLEFAGHDLVESDAFDLPPGRTVLVVDYVHDLPDVGADAERPARVYELPRSETTQAFEVPWLIDVRIALEDGLADVLCPTHRLQRERIAHDELRLSSVDGRHPEPGPLVLFPIPAEGDLNTLLVAWPTLPEDPDAGGYFALVAAPTTEVREAARRRARELTFVLDTSGSMAGEKLAQAREAARQVLESLRPDETFNVILYDTDVEPLFAEPQLAGPENLDLARSFLAAAEAAGGTNIDGALRQALRAEPSADRLPLVLFLTDGLPTSGERDERAILANADQRNGSGRRIFAFGVGDDLNAPLLDGLATRSGATSSFVRPGQDIEVAVGEVLERLTGGIFARPALRAADAEGRTLADAVTLVLPEALPDLFSEDQLLAVGRFAGAAPIELELSGDFLGEHRVFHTSLHPARALGRNGFVPQLWAARRNAVLIDEVRAAGAGGGTSTELRTFAIELLRLGLRFGALTEYTSFLALEGPGSQPPERWLEMTQQLLTDRALRARVGRAAVTQSMNTGSLRQQAVLNRRNRYVDDQAQEVVLGGVVPLGDRAYFMRDGTWVDSRLLEPGARQDIDAEITFASDEHRALVAALASRGEVAALALGGHVAITLAGRNFLVQRP